MSRLNVNVKNCIFRDNDPKICVPLVGRTEDELFSHAEAILAEAERLEATYPGRKLDVM